MASQERLSGSERTHVLSMGGIIAPISYTIVVIVLGLLWSGYSHVTQSLSELGGVGAPNAIIMNTVGLPLMGILIVFFALGLHYGLNKGRGSRIGSALVAVYGLGSIALAFFPWDVANLSSFTNMMHLLIGWPRWIALTLGMLVLARTFKNDLRWKNYWAYTLSTGLLTAVVIVFYAFVGIAGYMGVVQRILVAAQLLWVEIVAIKLFRSPVA